ncbi:arylamine N-acetyltransferase [Streptomyces sp. NPDC049687]|uniref:arylamine N-acetyltransferase n=1 Tax=Streptomyces sp. NPDC049687 TaxID=3365596 RepID=UPI0037A63B0F
MGLPPDDLDAYFRRIGWGGDRRPDAATLRGVHRAHVRSLPFENLDPVRGVVPSLALGDLVAKLVRGRRGGYCFEQNTLLAGALVALGLGVTRLAARVVLGGGRVEDRPLTHMVLLVEVPGQPGRPHLADVGFGSPGALLEAIPLAVGEEYAVGGRRHRLVHVPRRGPLELWALEFRTGAVWQAQYVFTLAPFEKPDFEVANWHIATHPRSPFRSRPRIQHLTPDGHLFLDGRRLVRVRADGTVTERELTDEAEARRICDEEFGIDVPESTVLLS